MKTKGLNIIEAVRALQDKKCLEIASTDTGDRLEGSDLLKTNDFTMAEILGTWTLVDPVITPQPGEVWEDQRQGIWWIFQNQRDDLLYRQTQYGGNTRLTPEIIHNQNGWRRVFPPVEEGNV